MDQSYRCQETERRAIVARTEPAYSSVERRRVIAAAGLGSGLEFFDLMLVSLLVIQISDDFGVGLAQMGAVLTAQLVATAVGGVMFGRLADLYGRKRVLTWTIWVFGVATAACAIAPDFGVFFALRVITGFGVGGEWAVGFALVNEVWTPKRRGLAGGAVQAAIWPAYAAAVFVAGAVEDWRLAFAIGILPVAAAIWVRYTCPESKQWLALMQGVRTAAEGRRRRQRSSLAQLFRGDTLKTLVLGTLVVFGAQYSYYVYASWMPTYLKSDLGISPGAAEKVLYVSATIGVVSYLSAGALSDIVGRRRALLAFAAVQLLSFIAFAALNEAKGPTAAIIASYFLISLGLGYFAIFGAWFGELFATAVRATASSFCYSVGRGIASFGPVVVGALAGRLGLAGGISTGVLAVVLLMVFARFLRDRKGRIITAAE